MSTMMDSEPCSSPYPWTVMIVGVPDARIDECMTAASPLPVIRADAGPTALEAIVAVRPVVVVLGPGIASDTLRALRARATAVRAALLELAPDDHGPRLEEAMRAAVTRAEAARAAARSRRPEDRAT